jgi:hypothetical protein
MIARFAQGVGYYALGIADKTNEYGNFPIKSGKRLSRFYALMIFG